VRRRPVQQLHLTASCLHQSELPLQAVRAGGRVPGRLHDIGRVVLLRHGHAVSTALLGVLVPDGLLPLLHDDQHPVHPEVALRRPAVPVPARHSANFRPHPGMTDTLTGAATRVLARKSSRRNFFKFMGATSLGAGLFLTRTEVSLGSISGCIGCGGGPCSPCTSLSGVQPCNNVLGGAYPCKTCQDGGGCPSGCATSGEWFCCPNGSQCRRRCSECNCPPGCANLSCYCFTYLDIVCRPQRNSGDTPCTCPPPPPARIAA
jgi:hypothetical protein